MPVINTKPRTMEDGSNIISYTDSVGKDSVTYTFENNQESLVIINRGLKPIQYSVGALTNVTLQPGESHTVNTVFISFSVLSTEGVQQFEIRSDEEGTQITANSPLAEVDAKVTTELVKIEQQNRINTKTPFGDIQTSAIFSDFEASHGWTGANTVDNTNIRYGTQGLRVASSNGVNGEIEKKQQINLKDKLLGLSFYVDNIANLAQVAIILQIDNDWGKSFAIPFDATTLRTGFNYVSIGTASLFPTPTSLTLNDLRNVTSVKLRAKSKAGVLLNVTFDMFLLINNQSNQPLFVIGFDDGHQTVYTQAKKIMSKYGYRGINYLVPSLIDTAGFFTMAQAKELRDMGWDTGAHTYNHVDLSTKTLAEVDTELKTNVDWMKENGFNLGERHLAYPYGGHSKDIEEIARKYFDTARTTIDGYESLPTWNRYRLRTLNMNGTVPIDQYKAKIDKNIENKQVLIFLFHAIQGSGSAYDFPVAYFQQLIDYLYQKNANVVTMSEISMYN